MASSPFRAKQEEGGKGAERELVEDRRRKKWKRIAGKKGQVGVFEAQRSGSRKHTAAPPACPQAAPMGPCGETQHWPS